jgi:hypothetical protein
VVGGYVMQTNFLAAAGPLTAAMIAKLVVGKNKLVNLAVAGSAAWFAVQELSSPIQHLMQDQFGYLHQLMSNFRG